MTKQMPDLSGFTCTEKYHKLTMGSLKFTDGWAFLANKVGCFWLADIVGSVQYLPKIKEQQNFIIWRIVVKDEKAIVDAHWDSEGTDKDGKSLYSKEKELYKQVIKYTDFPEGTFEFY